MPDIATLLAFVLATSTPIAAPPLSSAACAPSAKATTAMVSQSARVPSNPTASSANLTVQQQNAELQREIERDFNVDRSP
jgi:hypothetical protein